MNKRMKKNETNELHVDQCAFTSGASGSSVVIDSGACVIYEHVKL